MAGGRLMPMVLAGIRVGGIGWELNRRSQRGGREGFVGPVKRAVLSLSVSFTA
jgi:hypothetical protein